MVSGRFKSRTFRRVKVRLPGGSVTIHYVKRKPGLGRCAMCKTELKGVLRERPKKMQKTAKSKKAPERPYGGNLCSKCMRLVIKRKSRKTLA